MLSVTLLLRNLSNRQKLLNIRNEFLSFFGVRGDLLLLLRRHQFLKDDLHIARGELDCLWRRR